MAPPPGGRGPGTDPVRRWVAAHRGLVTGFWVLVAVLGTVVIVHGVSNDAPGEIGRGAPTRPPTGCRLPAVPPGRRHRRHQRRARPQDGPVRQREVSRHPLPITGGPDGHGFRDQGLEQQVLELTRSFGIGAQFGPGCR